MILSVIVPVYNEAKTIKQVIEKLLLFSIIILLGGFYFFWLPSKYVVPILTYHSVNYDGGGFFVNPEIFNKQMEYIKKKGYEVITLDALVRSIKDRKQLKRNKVVITFDDGYKDNFSYAYPVLKKFGFPATIFLVTDSMGKYSIDSTSNFLSWDDIIVMSKNKISFGGHTKTHLYLGNMRDLKVLREEIGGSKKAIEQKIGVPADYFCYPVGGFNETVVAVVVDAGYKGACTTNCGSSRLNQDAYQLNRIKVTNSDMTKPFVFAAKLSGYYNFFRTRKNSN